MDKVQIEDCQNLGNLDFINWEKFRDSRILITGSTGLIGKNLVNALVYNSQQKELNIKLFLPVRDVAEACKQFCWTDAKIFAYELGTELEIGEAIDYIVHLASPTSSMYFIEKPVDTMMENIAGYKALLDWAAHHPIKKFIGMSTMEVYGFPQKGHKVKENEIGFFETMNSRNSYPIAKIACEALCNSYYRQYDVPAVILRVAQTFGPGVKYNDNRVFAQFMRCVIEKRDIVLKSSGLTERSYLYTADAVSAILVSLLKAKVGEAYTVANPDTYCSIKEMAEMVAEKVAKKQIKIVYDVVEEIEELGYVGTLYMDLDVTKIMNLKWRPTVSLQKMYINMIRSVNDARVSKRNGLEREVII